MELVRGLHNVRPEHRDCAVTIGNFDGVHRGHLAVIDQLMKAAGRLGCPGAVMLFEPQPREFFQGEHAPVRLYSLAEKLLHLREAGVERVVVLAFNAKLRNLSAGDFLQQVLVERLGMRHLVIGDDFRFGCDRKGDYELLSNSAERYGFGLERTESFLLEGQRVSSTAVREALENNRLDEAERLLGRPYTITGRVVQGDQRGAELGAPTANIAVKRGRLPMEGVYAVRVTRPDGTVCPGVANLGRRPTVCGEVPSLEAHLFDFDGDLYGQRLQVRFVERIRGEQRFDSLDELRAQIHRDIEVARGLRG